MILTSDFVIFVVVFFIFHRYFAGREMPWKDFLGHFCILEPSVSFLSISTAIALITCHRVEVLKKSKVPVFIFIDEIRQLTKSFEEAGGGFKPAPEAVLLKAVANVLHSSDKPTVLISTLDHTPMLRFGM